jgi:nucleotide-binding universal stress UspA family protein
MSGIVCAIRGGPASQPTIEKSIQLAKETSLPVYFLYVVNLDFLVHTSVVRTHGISKELHEMGEFILLTAQSKAETQGVEAEGIVSHGKVGTEIISLCQDLNANYVVLGKPQGQDEKDVFTHERLSVFAQRIEDESDAKVVFSE